MSNEVRIEQSKQESERVQHIVTTRSMRPTNLSVAISPTCYIKFICDTCKVCKPDEFIKKDSMFYDQLKTDDEVLTDKNFSNKGISPPSVFSTCSGRCCSNKISNNN